MTSQDWIKDCYEENQELLCVWGCENETQFVNLVTEEQDQKSNIELRAKIINQIIATNAELAYEYAIDILHRPFPAGEPAIATDAELAYQYAIDILHRPFPAGEPAIVTSAEWSYWYTQDVLRGIFPAGEPAIATDANYAYYYARYILDGPFPAGEPAIKKDPKCKSEYETRFKVKL